MRFNEKVALVIGGTSGIGPETAIQFAQAGAKTVLAGCHTERGENVVREITSAGGDTVKLAGQLPHHAQPPQTDLPATVNTLCNLTGKQTGPTASSCVRDPVWKAIQAEALAHAENEPLLRDKLERFIILQPDLVAGIALVLGERMFEGSADQFGQLVMEAVQADPCIEEAMYADLFAIRRHDPATTSYLNPFLHFKGYLALQAYRISHWLWNNNRRPLAQHLQSRISEIYGVDIHPAAKIGGGVFIDHATGVVIGETSVVGNDVIILHGVTLGGTGKESGDRHPKVGSCVLIGAGAQLLGNITIGDGARVGAGSVVVKSVPPGDTAVGLAAQVKTRPTITVRDHENSLDKNPNRGADLQNVRQPVLLLKSRFYVIPVSCLT
jgi:serine O-acetyltransferase